MKGLGNSNTTKQYSTFDNNPYQNQIYYRLTQVDFDGKFEKLKIVSIVNSKNITDNLWANSSPSTNSFTLFIQASTSELVTIKIFDVSGKLIRQKQENIVNGENSFTYKELNEGMYLIQVESDYDSFSPLKTLVQ